MRVVFTTPILEYPAAGGPQLRIENSIKALARVCELDIIYRAASPSSAQERTNAYFSKYARRYTTWFDYPANRWLRLMARIIQRISPPKKSQHLNKLIQYINTENVDVVWFGYGNISYPLIAGLKAELPDVKVVCDTDSVWSRFILRRLPFVDGARRRKIQEAGSQKEAEEKAWVNLCEVTTAVSRVDARYYQNIATDSTRVHLFSNVIDLENYQITPNPPLGFIKPSIFLAGSYGPNSAMNMAANWILDEVLPIVRRTYPELHFYIVGRSSDREFGHRSGPNITVTGKLDSVLPYLCHADVALVPLKFESGTRFKILEAGACRIPLVSTTLGAEGIPVQNGKHVLIADSPDDFAKAIVRLLGDRNYAEALAQNCFELVKETYSVEALVKEAQNILEFLEND